MGTISSNIVLKDKMSGTLNKLIKNTTQLYNILNGFDDTGLDEWLRQVKQASPAWDALQPKIKQVKTATDQATVATKEFRSQLQLSGKDSEKLLNISKKIARTAMTYAGAKTFMSSSDEIMGAKARMGLILKEGESVEAVMTDIYNAAQRSRSSYSEMAQGVAKLGILTGDTFSSTDEIIAFQEEMNKLYVVSGATAAEAANSMLQINQAMASNRLQGDELRSVLEGAPMLAQKIAEYMGVTTGEMRDLASQGKITSKVIKNALFGAADEINKRFEEMPLLFSQRWEQIKNTVKRSFSDAFVEASKMLGSDWFEQGLQSIANIAILAARAVTKLMQLISGVGKFLQEHTVLAKTLGETLIAMFIGLGAVISGTLLKNVVRGWSLLIAPIEAVIKYLGKLGVITKGFFTSPAGKMLVAGGKTLGRANIFVAIATTIPVLINLLQKLGLNLDNVFVKVKKFLGISSKIDKQKSMAWEETSNFDFSGTIQDYDDLLNMDVVANTETADNTSKLNDRLEHLISLAERDAINRFTTAEIKVNMTNNNNISNVNDVDGFIGNLRTVLEGELAVVANGTHI